MGPSDGLHDTCGHRRCSGGRTRTLNNWTRTSRVADYTTPEWVGHQVSRARRSGEPPWCRPELGVMQPFEVVVPEDPPEAHADTLLEEVGRGRPAGDR